MLKINLSKQAAKLLKKAHPKHAKQIAHKIVELQQNSFPHDSIKLKGRHSNLYRADIGEYRIIYYTEEDILYVTIIGKRNDGEVYKILSH
ncbi:MAG: type II toxin-antitoxin system RelE/ParE family toxin [Pseudomonadota bacterium]